MNKNTFTLIELLVVVAIIGILAGMLLPVLNKARASARAASCLSNTKQIATAVRVYTTDNGGLFPYDPANSGGGARILLNPYMGVNSTTTFAKGFFCTEKNPNGTGKNIGLLGQIRSFSPFQGITMPATAAWAIDWPDININSGAAKNPATNGSNFVPGAGKSGLDLTTNFTGTVLDEFNNGRHGSKVSVSFVDGHAESMLPRKPAYDYHIDTAAAAEDNMFRAR